MKCSKCGFNIPGDSNTCTRCGTPIIKRGLTPTRYINEDFKDEPALSFLNGDSFGDRYRIEGEIGRGGMGKIYKAWDKELDIHVAIKMIHPELLAKPDTMARFKKEILIAREITHENVVRIYDFGELQGIKFISMQYIDGENLAELIHTSGTLSIETAINIARQICQGLKAAHKQDIIHRDLKPQNIMIDKNGKVFITDFGLAKSLEEAGLSMSGIVMGTPQYLSPEQAMGEKADQRSDIYMLGIIMYEMITGKELFFSETVIGYLQKHIKQKPTSPSTINLLIPPFFEKIILKCLEKEKSKRYRDVDELLRDLQKEKVVSGPIFFSARSRRILKYIALTLLIVIVVGASFYYFFLSNPEIRSPGDKVIEDNRKSVAVMNPRIVMGDKDSEQMGKAIQGLLITDLGQSPYFKVLSDAQLYDILKDLGLLEKDVYSTNMLWQIAERGNVNHIIWGTYTQVGSTARYDLEIWQKGQKTPDYLKVMGEDGEDIFAFVDKITRSVKDKFFSSVELKNDIDEEIGKITTTSPLAYKYYLEGRKFYWEGNDEKSIEALGKAIAHDPKFAMAYRSIASNYSYLGFYKQTVANLKNAFLYKTRVSERERYLIEAYYFSILEKSPRKAIEACRKLLERYPNDEEGIAFLGVIYRNREMWDLAEEQYRKLLKLNNRSQAAYLNLDHIFIARGMYYHAMEMLQKNKELFLEYKSFHLNLAKVFIYLKDYDRAISEMNEAISLEPSNNGYIVLSGHIYYLKEDFQKAENFFKRLIDSGDIQSQSSGHFGMIGLYLLRGQYKKGIEEAERGMDLCTESNLEADKMGFLLRLAYIHLRMNNPQEAYQAINLSLKPEEYFDLVDSFITRKIALHFLGWTHLQTNRIEDAKGTVRRLEQLIKETEDPKKMRLCYHLLGLICVKEKRNDDAIKFFEQALSLLSQQENVWDETAFYIAPLASVYYKTGNFEKAEELYKKIQNLTMGRLRWGDIYTRSFYWLGKIYHQSGKNNAAKANFLKFLKLWENVDPAIPEIVDAKNQLKLIN